MSAWAAGRVGPWIVEVGVIGEVGLVQGLPGEIVVERLFDDDHVVAVDRAERVDDLLHVRKIALGRLWERLIDQVEGGDRGLVGVAPGDCGPQRLQALTVGDHPCSVSRRASL
jgi:hypothetical protein